MYKLRRKGSWCHFCKQATSTIPPDTIHVPSLLVSCRDSSSMLLIDHNSIPFFPHSFSSQPLSFFCSFHSEWSSFSAWFRYSLSTFASTLFCVISVPRVINGLLSEWKEQSIGRDNNRVSIVMLMSSSLVHFFSNMLNNPSIVSVERIHHPLKKWGEFFTIWLSKNVLRSSKKGSIYR